MPLRYQKDECKNIADLVQLPVLLLLREKGCTVISKGLEKNYRESSYVDIIHQSL